MVVKPMSLLTRSTGDGVPTSLVVNGTRYSSVKKNPRLLKSNNSPKRGEVVPGNENNHHLCSPDHLRSKNLMFEKFGIDDDAIGHDIHHPSLHSPEMLSAKGHAISHDSRDELNSLRNRLASLRGSSAVSVHSNRLHRNGTIEEQAHKNWTRNNSKQIGKVGDIFQDDSIDDQYKIFQNPEKQSGNDNGSIRSRMQSLHGSKAQSIDQVTREDAISQAARSLLGFEKSRNNGSTLEVEELVNGFSRDNEKKDRPSRNRHRHEPSTMEFLTNGDVQVVYERDDRILQVDLTTTGSDHNPDKMGNPVRQAVHELAEKRRSRSRSHYQSTEVHSAAHPGPHTRSNNDKVEISKGLGNNNLRVPDAGSKGLLPIIDDVNRIQHRLQPSTKARDTPRSEMNISEANGRNGSSNASVVDVRDDSRPRHRRQQSPARVVQRSHQNNELRQETIRGFSGHKPNIHSSSSEQSQHSLHQSAHRNSHQSSDEREDHTSGSQPQSGRSSLLYAQDMSPSIHNLRSHQSSYEREDLYSHRSHHVSAEHFNRGRETGVARRGPKVGQTWFAATELQSNLLVEVDDSQFHLHKFPLLSRSGRLNRLVFESRDTNKDHIKLHGMPGGPEAFELAVKFCYGTCVEITPMNVATLRCAAEYLEMTDSLEDGNLVSKTEHYLSFVTLASWKDSITVLQSCRRLLPWTEELQIVRRCTESVAWKACTDPHGIRWSFSRDSNAPVLWDGGKSAQIAKHVPHDWWVEDIMQLNFEAFSRVMTAIKVKGMAYTLVGSAIARYAMKRLPGLEKKSRKHHDANRNMMVPHNPDNVTHITGKEIVVRDSRDEQLIQNHEGNMALVEGIVGMLPPQQDAVPCGFLLRLLRLACMLGAGVLCREELERRVGMQMEHASLSDLLIPTFQNSNNSLYDIDTVRRILEHFLFKDHSSATSPTKSVKNEKQLVLFENSSRHPPTASHMTKIKVAKLMDAYLTEVARDTNLSLAKFQSLAESLPKFIRASDDGLYRAIDTYLKTHPTMIEHERKKLCRVMDCQRLSLEACLHAAQNERLPLRVVVQVLFSEQVKLRNAITGNSIVKKSRDDHSDISAYPSTREHLQSRTRHQIVIPRVDNSNAGGLSLQESLQSARQDIKSLTQEIENMKSKFSDLEHDYSGMTPQVEKLSKSKSHSTSGWTSGWRKLSMMKPPKIFNNAKLEYDHHLKDDESVAPSNHTSTPTHDQSTPTSAAGDKRRRSLSVTSTSSVQRWRNSIS